MSIGMPVYNCESTIAYSISSILSQSFENWEFLIIDDGSTDNTLDIANSFSDPRIRVIRGGENKKLPARLNECVSMAIGTYFARMDGDDIAYPSRLQAQLDFLRAHPDVDLTGGWISVFSSDGVVLGARRAPETHERICQRPWSGIAMAHPTWMGKTEWFRSHPYSPGALRMEDWDLLYRTYKSSRFANLQTVVLGYREDSLSLRQILLARKNICRTVLRRIWADRSPWQAIRGTTGQFARFLVDAVAISSGMQRALLAHRTPPVSAQEAAEWRAVWNGAHEIVLQTLDTSSEPVL